MITLRLLRIITLLHCGIFLEKDTGKEESKIDNISVLEDYHFMCRTWAEKGLCNDDGDENYVGWILDECPKSCFVSTMMEDIMTDAIEGNVECAHTGESDYDTVKDSSMSNNLNHHQTQFNFGVPQYVDIADPMALSILRVIRQTALYYCNHKSMITEMGCENKKDDCSFSAAIGMCQTHVIYMELNCSPACQSCHSYLKRTRCNNSTSSEYDDEGEPILWPSKKGDLNKMFTDIVEMESNQIEILSFPFTNINHKYKWHSKYHAFLQNQKQPLTGPWLLAYDNFLSDNETDTIIRLGETLGFQPSTISSSPTMDDNGIEYNVDDITNKSWRTSHTTWCDYDCIEKNKTMKEILERIVTLTGIDVTHTEPIQLLRYQIGQFYVEHHDYIPYDKYLPSGPRILTVFIYLNDLPPDGGGGTHFPFQQHPTLTITPKKGTMLIWPNVQDSHPFLPDDRMRHEALPVKKGIKYGANIWLHLKDYQSAYERNCT